MKERVIGLFLGVVLGIAGTNIYISATSAKAPPKEPASGDETLSQAKLLGTVQPPGPTPNGGISLVPWIDMRGWDTVITIETEDGFGSVECSDPIAQPDNKQIICDQ